MAEEVYIVISASAKHAPSLYSKHALAFLALRVIATNA